MQTLALVLAGGASRRMGVPKAMLDWQGKPLLRHVVERLQPHFERVVVVGGSFQTLCPSGVVYLEDEQPGAGAAMAIWSALRRLKVACFVCGCDMPFVHPELGRWLLEVGTEFAAHIPRWSARPQPLHAAWFPESLSFLESSLSAGERAVWRVVESMDRAGVVRWAEEVDVRRFDGDGRCFVNLNTVEDWERWAAARERR